MSFPDAPPLERFRTQKTAALLAFLALKRGVHRRETLCELFWPGSEPESARNSLRVSLSALRGLLEPPGVLPGAALQIARDTVALASAVETDVALFRGALNMARDSRDTSARRGALEKALALYRGPLLRGHDAEWIAEWMMGEEGRLEDQFLAAFASLVPLWEAEGQRARALDAARRAVAAAPAREEPVRELLRLGLQIGQAAQVSREWEMWRQRAVRDGISVGETTLELARAAAQTPVSNLSGHPSGHPSGHAAASRPSFSGASQPTRAAPAPTLAPRAGSLPAQWTTFFGRAADLQTLQQWLESSPNKLPTQLVTLSGPGGVGKTRLALEVARRLEGGAALGWVKWLPLADLPQADLLPGAILDALRLPRGDASLDDLIAALRHEWKDAGATRFLLVLDNFEHLCEVGAPLLRSLLEAVPQLRCLVTSRRRLGFAGEREWPLQPLETPVFESMSGPLCAASEIARGSARFEALRAAASVQLFLDRAHGARPDFTLTEANIEAVAQLCATLDGLPLALELAAARVALFSPAQILAGLGHQHHQPPPQPKLQLARDRAVEANAVEANAVEANAANAPLDWENLDRAAPARHRSLRAAIAWSQHQLPPKTAQFWSKLSTFRGGWTLDAASFVCEERDAAPLMLALRDVSLLSLDTRDETPRGHQLEALREYASEGLSAAQRHHIAARHAEYFLTWAEGIKPHLDGARATHFLSRLETERDNLIAAFFWLLEHDIEGALRLCVALYWSWELRGRVEEGRRALNHTLQIAAQAFPDVEARAPTSPDDARRLHLIACARIGAGKLATVASDLVAAREHLEAALRFFRALGDDQNSADCLYSLGYMHLKSGDLAQARALCDESVAISHRLGNRHALCDALYNRALVALCEGDFGTVRTLNNERLAIHRAAGEQRGVAISLESLGLAALFSGEVDAARAYLSESRLIFEAIGEWFSVVRTLWGLGHVARVAGHLGEAQTTFFRALEMARDSQTLWTLPYLLEGVAYLATDAQPQVSPQTPLLAARGARLLGAASLLRETHAEPLPNPMFGQKWQETVAALRESLGEAHFESQWQLGRALSPDAMISFALATEI